MNRYAVIVGSGSCIPDKCVKNAEFGNRIFFEADGKRIARDTGTIIAKFTEITGIEERRLLQADQVTSDMAFIAAHNALTSSGTNPETLDYIIVAHNFGDVKADLSWGDQLPSIASKVRHLLKIKNPNAVPYDIIFGCAGWLQAFIQAECLIKSGCANKILVIGAEGLSRVIDPYDRDSMIFADGAGAVIVEAVYSNEPVGIITHQTNSYSGDLTYVLKMGPSYNPEYIQNKVFIKMQGRTLYEYALKFVPKVIKDVLDKAGLQVNDIAKFLIHQANTKMDEAILKRLFALYNVSSPPDGVMPMTIRWLGNSSVATLPTLYDLLIKQQLNNHKLNAADNLVFASVGAGVNINAVVYKMPSILQST